MSSSIGKGMPRAGGLTRAKRCPLCGGLNGQHGLVHRRHESGGGGSNVRCPNDEQRRGPDEA